IHSLRDETVIRHQQRPVAVDRDLAAGPGCLIDPRIEVELFRGTTKVFNVHYGVSTPILLVSCETSREGWGRGARPGESALNPAPVMQARTAPRHDHQLRGSSSVGNWSTPGNELLRSEERRVGKERR